MPSRLAGGLLALLLLLLPPPALAQAANSATAPALPAPVCSALENCRMVGQGTLRWWGFHAYDASLWSRSGRWQVQAPYALDIRYARRISGAQLAATSIDEMRRLGVTDAAVLARWEAAMRSLFPDVVPGSRLIGLHVPGRGALFYNAERFLGAIEEVEFARHFFAIWLDARTQTPELRAALLAADGRTE